MLDANRALRQGDQARAWCDLIPRRTHGTPQPFPLDPVVELLSPGGGHKVNGRRSDGQIAAVVVRLRSTRGRVHRLLRDGLDAYQADAIAIELGVHPCIIWPEWFNGAELDDSEHLEVVA